MYRSVVIQERSSRDGGSPTAAFIDALVTDLKYFGRDDVALVTVDGLKILAWDPSIPSSGSIELRAKAMSYRLRGEKANLEAMEAALPSSFFEPFDVDLLQISPEVVVCSDSPSKAFFDYVVWGQSMPADIKNFRNTKVLLFDGSLKPKRLMGAILLKSPMYFDGARDAHLGWPGFFTVEEGRKQKNQQAIDLRNKALKSIYNIGVCMLVPPFNVHGMGKLIASLCFSPEIVAHLEHTFGQPVLGMTTTGGWGGNATQYDRLNIAARAEGGRRPLFTRTHCARPSLHFPTHLFSGAVIEQAIAVIKADNRATVKDFANYENDPQVAVRAFKQACKLIGIPFRATASNCVAHYFGSVSDACTNALRSSQGIDEPPPVRWIAIDEAVTQWRKRQKLTTSKLSGISARRLSDVAS